mgnify:CR=1 FL=1
MKFVLYGSYSPITYVDAYTATNYKGFDFSFVELDCESVLIAFYNGREVDRTYDMDGLNDWVAALVTEPPSSVEAGWCAQYPLSGLDTPSCR